MKKKIKKHFIANFSCRHPKLWEYIKSNVKVFFITGAITFVVTASATTILHSRQVRYKNDKSVEQAINELYKKAEECGLILMDNNGNRYEQVEYIQSTGSQYIDTNILYDSSKIYDITTEMSFTNISSRQLTGWDAGGAFGVQLSRFYNGDSYSFPVSENVFYKINLIIDLSNSILRINDNSIYTRGHGSLSTYATNKGYPVFTTVSKNSYMYYLYSKLKYLKIKVDDTLIRDYIPVLDSNDRPCLFDKVDKKCYYNQGTGEFLYG